jgi:hypothetical protein
MSVGIFSTSNLTQDLARKSFAGLITRLMPNGTAPLFGMTSMLESETAVQIEHGFFTKTMLFPQLTLSASALSTDTTFTVTSTSTVLPGMIMRVDSTGENVIVNSVISATSVSVTRAVGNVSAQAISSSVALYQVGNAYEEASLRPNALIINPVRITNLTQIFRNTWAISDTIRSTMMIAGDTNVSESRQDCAAFHAADIEKAFFFGQKSQGTRNGQPFRTMDGLISIIGQASSYPSIYGGVTNVWTAGSTTNYTQLEGFLDPVFNQATDPKVANERVLFVGGTAKKVLNNIGRLNGTYMMVDGATSWGLQFSTFKTARGTFRVIEHPLFNSNTSWAKMAVAVDLSTFRAAYLGDRKTQNKEFNMPDASDMDVSDNGIDAVGGTLTTEVTCVVKNPPANAVIYNLTAGATG